MMTIDEIINKYNKNYGIMIIDGNKIYWDYTCGGWYEMNDNWYTSHEEAKTATIKNIKIDEKNKEIYIFIKEKF